MDYKTIIQLLNAGKSIKIYKTNYNPAVFQIKNNLVYCKHVFFGLEPVIHPNLDIKRLYKHIFRLYNQNFSFMEV